jgi:hypothetical protein
MVLLLPTVTISSRRQVGDGRFAHRGEFFRQPFGPQHAVC